jgi:septal ring factor EnvC (AmiA/AmiB activator)
MPWRPSAYRVAWQELAGSGASSLGELRVRSWDARLNFGRSRPPGTSVASAPRMNPSVNARRLALVLLVVLAPSGCMRPLTRRLDFISDQLVIANQQIAETNRTLVETRAILVAADQRIARVQTLLARANRQVSGTNGRLDRANGGVAETNRQLTELRGQIHALLGRMPDLKPGG